MEGDIYERVGLLSVKRSLFSQVKSVEWMGIVCDKNEVKLMMLTVDVEENAQTNGRSWIKE